MTFIKAVVIQKPMETINFLLVKRIPIIMLNLLENPIILPDLQKFLLRPQVIGMTNAVY